MAHPAAADTAFVSGPAESSLAKSTRPAPGERFLRSDERWWVALSIAGAASVAFLDRRTAREFPQGSGLGVRRLARLGEHFGNPLYVAPALLAGFAYGRLAHHPGLALGSVRVGSAVLGAGVVCEGLKLAVGRERPLQAPDDPMNFRPFHGATSFPSGHTTVAFALAAALDEETQARWIPWVAYPAAALTGWSRVHDREHWLSDAAAGAALGFWAGRLIDRAARKRTCGLLAPRVFVTPGWRGAQLGLRMGF